MVNWGFRSCALVAALSLVACDGSPSEPPVVRPTVVIAPLAAQVEVGSTRTLTATIENGSGPIIWRSAAPNIATVNEGVVTGVAIGETQVRALLASDTTISATANIFVLPPSPVVSGPDTLPVLGHGRVDERYTGEVAVRGNWAYTTTWSNRNGRPGNAVKVWNVSGNTPVLADSLIISGVGTTGDVQISDDGALLVVATEFGSAGSIVIFDRTNPQRPQQLSRFSSGNTTLGVHTVKLGRVAGRHYAFLSINPGGQTSVPARLVIVDITNPSAPFEVWSQPMGQPYVHDTFVRDGILFAANWNAGVRIMDIGGGGRGGTPSAPVVIANALAAAGNIHNIWWFHDPTNGSKRYLFLGEEQIVGSWASGGEIHVFDISDMANPRQVAIYNVPGAGTHNFWMDEASGILYAAYYNGGVRALDVRGDLGTCADNEKANGLCHLRLMGREKAVALTGIDPYIWGVVHQGTHVYASDMRLGLFKLDAAALKR